MHKKEILFILFSFFILKSVSQELNFYDLRYICNYSIDKVDKYLSKKGFNFDKEFIEKTEKKFICETYNWEKNTKSDKIQVILKGCDEYEREFSSYTIRDVKIFEKFKTEIINWGFTLSKETVENDLEIKFFTSDEMLFSAKYIQFIISSVFTKNNNGVFILSRILLCPFVDLYVSTDGINE